MVKFENLYHSKKLNKIVFQIYKMDVSIVNSIRRTILSNIPNVGFKFDINEHDDKINILKNTCSLHNEFLKHRLSLIPIHFTPDEILEFDNHTYKCIIHKHNTTNTFMEVTTQDIDMFKDDVKLSEKELRQYFPKSRVYGDVYDWILITKLKPNVLDNMKGDEIHIEMIPSISTAGQHAGFSYVSQCSYEFVVDDESQEVKDAYNKKRDEYIQQYEKNGIQLTKEQIDNFMNDFNNLDKQRLYMKNSAGEPCAYEFSIECEYSIKPEYLFFKAILLLIYSINTLIENININAIEFEYINGSEYLYDLTIENENDTLGNMLQSLLYNVFIKNGESQVINYVGYRKNHPLYNKIVLRIGSVVKDSKNLRKEILMGLDLIKKELIGINKKWIDVSKLDETREVKEFLN